MDNNASLSHEFWQAPVSMTLIRQLHTLAFTPFLFAAFRSQWQAFGWSYIPDSSDAFGFYVTINDQLRLLVQPSGGRIGCATLPFCYWERYHPENHPTIESYRQARQGYDRIYEQVFQTTVAALDPPQYVGRDIDTDAHSYAVWRSEHALLLLQQCAFDVQFGVEINFWLEPHHGETFVPTSPLVDWLVRRHLPED